MNKLTASLLKHINACDFGIDFFVRNNLEGISLEDVKKIEGDFGNYMLWLDAKMPLILSVNENEIPVYTHEIKRPKKNGKEITRVYDDHINVIKFTNTIVDEDGNVSVYEEQREYEYVNNVLHKITDVVENKVLVIIPVQ